MSRFTILAALCAALATAGCSTRVEVEHEQTATSELPAERTTTVVEVSSLESPPPVPAEPPADPEPQVVHLDEAGNVIVFGDVEYHRVLHIHEAREPSNVRVDVRVEVAVVDERDRRRRMVEQRLAELLERR